jgi:hypothetical protein
MKPPIVVFALLLICAAMMSQPTRSFCQATPAGDEPPYLRDRGTGIPMSIFGTYVRQGELLIYPFYEYYYDNNLEYKPSDFGFPVEQDFRGRYRAHEGILFMGYGISDKFAIEVEAGIIDAKLNKADEDRSGLPAELKESGLSDVEGQIRWRWNHESAKTPEYYSYFLAVLPTGKENSLIGTSDWELKLGIGLIKGFSWGTITPGIAIEYAASEKTYDFAYGLEYLKKISERVRFFAMLEGTQDEAAFIPEIQWRLSRSVLLKVNNGFGLTSKAVDMAPEIGIMFSTK